MPEHLLSSYCAPIDVPIDDNFFGPRHQTCLEFLRASQTIPNDCDIGPDIAANAVSSYGDLTILYGDFESTTMSLRNFTGGLMNINEFDVLPLAPCGDQLCYVLGLCIKFLGRYN